MIEIYSRVISCLAVSSSDQINILEEHSQVNLKNARTIAIHGHLRLVVDSHAVYGGQIIPNPEAVPIDKPSNLPNMSDIEFTKI